MTHENALHIHNDEEAIRQFPLSLFLSLIAILGFLGNSVVIYIYTRVYTISNSRVFIRWLAAVDLMTCILAIPLEIFLVQNQFEFKHGNICKSSRFINSLGTVTSATLLVLIAIDRYRKICKPLSWQIRNKCAKVLCFLAFLFGCGFSIPNVILYGVKTSPVFIKGIQYNGSECSVDDSFDNTKYPLVYNVISAIMFITAAIMLVVMYLLIGRKVRFFAKRRETRHSSSSVWLNSNDSSSREFVNRKKEKNDQPPINNVSSSSNKKELLKKESNAPEVACQLELRQPIKTKNDECFHDLLDVSDGERCDAQQKSYPDSPGGESLMDTDDFKKSSQEEHDNCSRETNLSQSDDTVVYGEQNSKKEVESKFFEHMDGRELSDNTNGICQNAMTAEFTHGQEIMETQLITGDYEQENSTSHVPRNGSCSNTTSSEKFSPESKTKPTTGESQEINNPVTEIKTKNTDFSDKQIVVSLDNINSCSSFNETSPEIIGNRPSSAKDDVLHVAQEEETNTPIHRLSRINTIKVHVCRMVSFKKHHRVTMTPKIKNSSKRLAKNTTFMMFLITLVFLLTFSPYLLLVVLREVVPNFLENMDDAGRTTYRFFLRSYFVNSATNPFIYSIFDKRFRKACKKTIANISRRFHRREDQMDYPARPRVAGKNPDSGRAV